MKTPWIMLAAVLAPCALTAESPPPPKQPREPERRELWVPAPQWEEVMKAHPQAVMLTPEEYERLVRDAGLLPATDPKDHPQGGPPAGPVLEALTLRGRVSPGATVVRLSGELPVRFTQADWQEVALKWPWRDKVTALSGTYGLWLAQEDSSDTPRRHVLRLTARGPARHILRFEVELPVQGTLGARSLFIPFLAGGGVLELDLPPDAVITGGHPHERRGGRVVAVFTHYAQSLTWNEPGFEAARPDVAIKKNILGNMEISEMQIVGDWSLSFQTTPRKSLSEPVHVTWELDEGVEVTGITCDKLLSWRQEGSALHLTLTQTSQMWPIQVRLRRDLAAGPENGNGAARWVEVPQLSAVRQSEDVKVVFPLRDDLEILEIEGMNNDRGRSEIYHLLPGVTPRLLVRSAGPRLEVDVDTLARVEKDEARLSRKLTLHVARPLTETRVLLPAGEDFDRVECAWQGFSWKRVDRALELRFPGGLKKGQPLEVTLHTRRRLPPGSVPPGSLPPATVARALALENVALPDAVRVAGYTALDFDDSWRARVRETRGLEDRDARMTPVRGRMAWFGLREWTLSAELERAEPVFAAEIRANALPRARTVEIEGELLLDISGAPMRSFQARLPAAAAPLLRMTSPLVAERSLDEAQGLWTFTLLQETLGRVVLPFRLSLPAAVEPGAASPDDAPDAPALEKPALLSHRLPVIEIEGARRFRGSWIIEANTDTQISFETRGTRPLDVLRAPALEHYQPRHRLVGAFEYGAGGHELTLRARRHAASGLPVVVVTRMVLSSALGADGSARHEAILHLRHSGEQFARLRPPQGARLLSARVEHAAVKPVLSAPGVWAIPLPGDSANRASVHLVVLYDLPVQPWGGSGTLKVEPLLVEGGAPVLETDWRMHVPAAFSVQPAPTALAQQGAWRVPGLLEKLPFLAPDPMPASAPAPLTRPAEIPAENLIVRVFKVPSDIVSRLLSKDGNAGESAQFDPFAPQGSSATETTAPAQPELLPGSPEWWVEQLKRQGIPFPGGSLVLHDTDRAELIVRQTAPNLEVITTFFSILLTPAESRLMLQGTEPDPAFDARERAILRMKNRMQNIILPKVNLSGATLEAALEDLRRQSREHDPIRAGIPILNQAPDASMRGAISLDLRDVPLVEALRYVTELAGVKYKVEGDSIVVLPVSDISDSQFTRVFNVRPDFLSLGGAQTATLGGAVADPFSSAGAPAAGLIQRASAEDILKAQGVPIPEGASVVFNPVTSQLIVKNTEPNLDLIEAFVDGIGVASPESPAKAGLLPLDFDLPKAGRVLRFHGPLPPETLTLRHASWQRQMARACLWMLAGALGFIFWGRHRAGRRTFLLVLLAGLAVPLFLEGLIPAANALLCGWLAALLVWLPWRALERRSQTAAAANPASSSPPVSALTSLLVLACAQPSEAQQNKEPAAQLEERHGEQASRPFFPDPAAHTVLVPYDPALPPAEWQARQFYLPYADFQRLWQAAKENRRPAPDAAAAAKPEAAIVSALYRARVLPAALEQEVLYEVISKGAWAPLPLEFKLSEGVSARMGDLRVNDRPALLKDGALLLEKAGRHTVSARLSFPMPEGWREADLWLPRAAAGLLSLRAPAEDGWPRINHAAATTADTAPDGGRVFTAALGNHARLHIQRQEGRALQAAQTPPASALTRTRHIFRVSSAREVESVVDYEFPGTARRALEFSADADFIPGSLEVKSGTPADHIPVSQWRARREQDRVHWTLHLAREAADGARLTLKGARTGGGTASVLIQPVAGRLRQEVTLLHEAGLSVRPLPAAGQTRADAERAESGLLWAGSFRLGGTECLAFEAGAAPAGVELRADWVFQISQQKCELFGALALTRQNGRWTRARVDLPEGYDAQSVDGADTWQQEGAALYLHFDPADSAAALERRLVLHLVRIAEADQSQWQLSPPRLAGVEKHTGSALIVAGADREVRLTGLPADGSAHEADPGAIGSVFEIAPPFEVKRGLRLEGVDWTAQVTLQTLAPRFSVEAVALLLVSDTGVRLSQQVALLVEQGAPRQITVGLPAALPQAVVTGPLLRETRTRIEDGTRFYDCTLQSGALQRAELTFDHDLPLTSTFDAPFVQVPGARSLRRYFVLDDTSSRESRVAEAAALEEVARASVPWLPEGLARPRFYQATGEGALRLAHDELEGTEGQAALITLAGLTTHLRADGSRWETVEYSLINRSLQFLPVILPPDAELVSVTVSGTEVRADEEARPAGRVRLIPLIHTRPGQRALQVRLVWRHSGSDGAPPASLRMSDPRLDGLSAERTTWTVRLPPGWTLREADGNMEPVDLAGRERQKLEGMISELSQVNRDLASGKLGYDDAALAVKSAESLASRIENAARNLGGMFFSRASEKPSGPELRGAVSWQESAPPSAEAAATVTKLDQQRRILDENWKAYEGKDRKTQAPPPGSNTTWLSNSGTPMPSAGANTFANTAPAQVLSDNIAVNPVFNRQTAAGGAEAGQQLVSRNARANNLSNASPEELARLRAAQVAQVTDPFGAPPMPAPIDALKQVPRSETLGTFSGDVRVESKRREVVPSMSSDPFVSQAPASPGALPRAAAQPSAEGGRSGETTAQPTVADAESAAAAAISALRPTGRRSLRVEPPAEGAEWHFSKLKDHAILDLRLRRVWTPRQITHTTLLALGLLAWGGLKLRQHRLQPTVTAGTAPRR